MSPVLSEQLDKILPKVFAARSGLSGVRKGKTNPAFKSKYADLEAVIDAIQPEFSAEKLLLTQQLHPGPSPDTLSLHTVVYDVESCQHIGSNMTIPLLPDPQRTGGWITYAKRYSILALLGLPTEDDDGNHASGRPGPPARNGSDHEPTRTTDRTGLRSSPPGAPKPSTDAPQRTYVELVAAAAAHYSVPATAIHRRVIAWAADHGHLAESYDCDDPRQWVTDLTALYSRPGLAGKIRVSINDAGMAAARETPAPV